MEEVNQIRDIAIASTEPINIDAHRIQVLVPPNYNLREIQPLQPEYTTAAAVIYSFDDFITYVTDFKNPGTRIFANPDNQLIKAVIDFDTKEKASHRTHRPQLVFQESLAFKSWKELAQPNNYITQKKFAEFIELRIKEIAEPDMATITNVARNLEATVNQSFKQSTRLANGDSTLQFETVTTSKVGNGDVDVPESMKVVFEPFKYLTGDKGKFVIVLDVALRHRVNEGKLLFQVVIRNLDDEMEKLWGKIVDTLKKDAGVTVYIGQIS